MTKLASLLTLRGWVFVGIAVAAVLLCTAIYLKGRAAADGDRAVVDARAVVKGGEGRETAATERTLDTITVDQDLKDWNHAAEQTPDAAPDARELRRRCRQLRDVHGADLAVCRGFTGQP